MRVLSVREHLQIYPPVMNFYIDFVSNHVSDLPSLLMRGVFRRRAAGWSEDRRSAVRLVTGARKARDPARQALRPVCEELAARIGRECPRWKRGPRPKIAAVERREARTPDRKGVQRRLASAFGAPRKRTIGCLASTRAVSALRSPSSGSKCEPSPGRNRAAGTRKLVRCLKSLIAIRSRPGADASGRSPAVADPSSGILAEQSQRMKAQGLSRVTTAACNIRGQKSRE